MTQLQLFENENILDELELEREHYDDTDYDYDYQLLEKDDLESDFYEDDTEYCYNGCLNGCDEDLSDCCFRSKAMHITDIPESIYI